jgi:non-ribosomal peptide synthase protein (TIGR01720 family)
MSNASFDAATFEIWGAWLFGGQLIIISKDVALSPRELTIQLRQYGITTLFVTTTLFNHIAMEVPTAFGSVKQVLFGGEAVDTRWVREVLSKGKPERLLHVYGPTETTTYALWHLVEYVEENAKTIPIGKPISNMRVYVVDHELRPVPVGVPGQLCISGDGLARDYLNRPELTAERFVPNPFSHPASSDARGDARMYLTGDVVRYLPDGNIEFLGRMDRQVKIHGFRVELGEIETLLRQHSTVRECAVALREDVPGDRRLIAYVVPSQPAFSDGELRRFLQLQLPEYMIPAAFVPLHALPLTPSGKVDSRALPPPDRSRSEMPTGFAAPRTPAEQTLAAIWADVIGIDRVGINDNFFELGGDSILSIQVVARANQAGLKLTPRQIFQYQTIARLAAEAGSVATIPSEQGPVLGAVPLTPIQRWFFEQKLPDPQHFNQSLFLRLRSQPDPSLLEKAVQSLLAHHDALRLRFIQADSGWSQFSSGLGSIPPLEQTDLAQIPETQQEHAAEAVTAELQSSLNLSEGPLVRFHLFRFGPDKPDQLLIIAHHLVMDGVSWRILLEDLETAYDQVRQNKEISLPPKTTSFRSWAEQLIGYARSPRLRQELSYWWARSQERVSSLPLDYPEAASENTVESSRKVCVSLKLNETHALLHQVYAAYHTLINDVLLTGLVQTLAPWVRSRSFLIDLEGHGREEIIEGAVLSRTIGWFTSIFPVYLQVEDRPKPGQALKSIKEQLRQVPNKGIGYGLARYLSQDAEIAHRLQALQRPELSFNYLGQFDQSFAGSSLFEPVQPRLRLAQSPRGRRDHVLTVNASIVQGQLQVEWSYSQNLHRQATIESLASHYVEALRSLIEHCQSADGEGYTPSDFPEAGLSQPELDALLGELGEVTQSNRDG